MKICLPIELDSIITSECWTFYKVSILQKQPYFNLWLTDHLNVYIDKVGDSYYGEHGIRYPLSYFSDVLDISEEPIHRLSKETIVAFLCDRISEGHYIVMALDDSTLYNLDTDLSIHDTLIYGFDSEEKCFFSPRMNSGKFKEHSISFDAIAESFGKIKNHYLSNPADHFVRRRFFYPVTMLKPREKYQSSNWDYNLFVRLKRDRLDIVTFTDLFDVGDFCESGDGLRKFLKYDLLLRDLLELETVPEYERRKLMITTLKFYESHELMSIVFDYAVKWYDRDALLGELYNQYREYTKQMGIIKMKIVKYLETDGRNILSSVKSEMKGLHHKEKKLYACFADRMRAIHKVEE